MSFEGLSKRQWSTSLEEYELSSQLLSVQRTLHHYSEEKGHSPVEYLIDNDSCFDMLLIGNKLTAYRDIIGEPRYSLSLGPFHHRLYLRPSLYVRPNWPKKVVPKLWEAKEMWMMKFGTVYLSPSHLERLSPDLRDRWIQYHSNRPTGLTATYGPSDPSARPPEPQPTFTQNVSKLVKSIDVHKMYTFCTALFS